MMWYLLCDPRQRCARISLACCHFHLSRVSKFVPRHCRLVERVRDRCRAAALSARSRRFFACQRLHYT
jgi:hypothetical protein